MKSSWIAGLTKDQEKELRADYISAFGMRKRLVELLNKKIDVKRESVLSIDQYASPSWSMLQADAIGYERAMKEIILLISDDKVEK